MNFPSEKFEVNLASEQDLEGIKDIFESGEFQGNIAVQYLRNPNPIGSFEKEGDKVAALVLKDKTKNKPVGLGVCVIRKVYKNGEVVRMGYLSGFKILPEYQKKIFFIPQIYEMLYEETKDEVDFYFTTILSDNIAVQKMLEKPRKRMPLYQYIGDYYVYFCKAGIKKVNIGIKNAPKKGLGYTARRCNKKEIEKFYHEQGKKAELSLEAIDSYDLKNAVYYGLFQGEQIVACGYVLNQQSYKQYVVKHYKGVYRLLSKLPTRCLGYPSFPVPNETANCACAGIWAKDYDETLVHKLWQFMRQDARTFDFIMIGLHESYPLKPYFENTKHIRYDSRCYIVDWNHDKTVSEYFKTQNLYIDTAFL